jgi:hypothetical protein
VTVEIELGGVPRLAEYFRDAPKVTRRAASMAINQTAIRVGLGRARAEMLRETAFPRGYLNDPSRFGLRKQAKPEDLEAVIFARTRPTSLARFARWGATRTAGATVTVNPGAPKQIKQAFRVNLRSGNVGLAVRVGPGGEVRNRKVPAKVFDSGIALLYGPSVDQVFRDVRHTVAPEAMTALQTEFLRQFVRLSRT